MISIKRLLFITLLAVSFSLHASDLAKEKRWADQVVDAILDGEAIIIQTLKPLEPAKQALVDKILQRLDGVLQVRESKYIMLNAPKDALDRIAALLPGSEAPTVVPLDGSSDRVAVHAVCTENVFWETLENLKAAGATSLLVLPIEKMLA